VDGLVATAPFYIRPSQDEIAAHYQTLRAAVDLPLLAYDIPQNVHLKLERGTIATLAHEGVIDGLKDSSGDEGNFRGVLLDTRDVDGFVAFTGSERMVDALLQAGAHGCVPGIGNVDPAGFVRIYDAVKAGDLDAARADQDRLFRLFAITRQATRKEVGPTASALGGFKTALQLLGVIATNVPGRPMTRLNEDEAAGVRAVLVEAGLL
jgi:4-hydroxy-tetrahydrodipicolinate synthase